MFQLNRKEFHHVVLLFQAEIGFNSLDRCCYPRCFVNHWVFCEYFEAVNM